MKLYPMRFNLSQKGLALVGALLAMELCFVAFLYGMLQDSEKYAVELARSKTIISKKDRLLQLLSEANNAFTYSGAEQAAASTAYLDAVAEFPLVVDDLERLLAKEPARLEVLHDANALMQHEVDMITKFTERFAAFKLRGGDPTAEELELVRKCVFRAQQTRDTIVRMLFNLDAPERKLESQLPQLEAKSRDSLRHVLVIGAIFNLVLAIGLGLAFVRNITGRVSVLVDNTNRLSRKQPLNPEMGGEDEISHLDRTFHSMASALREAEARDLEIQKMKEEFVAMASHELRSPLSSVQGTLTLLSEGVFGPLSEEAQSRVQRAENNVSRLIALINDLLDTEKMKAGKLDMQFEEVDVTELIMKSVAAVSDLAEGKNIEICGVEPDATIHADKARLIQVMVNLLSNAIKYSPQNSRINIDVDEDDAECVTVKVRDQGDGIAPQFLNTIFGKYEQGQAAPEVSGIRGTGLGLSIAKQIVEQHGGTIGVDSIEGKGSEFWFQLPRACSADRRSAPEVVELRL